MRLVGPRRSPSLAARDRLCLTHEEPESTPMLAHRYSVVDAFTDRPFSGNPAAVVPLAQWKEDAWLQSVAMEMNLSETAFIAKQGDGFRLRWFTPKIEVVLCGHATLASAHVLWSEGHASADDELRFHTKSGLLSARRNESLIEARFSCRDAVIGGTAARIARRARRSGHARRTKSIRLSGRGGIGRCRAPDGPGLRSPRQHRRSRRDRYQPVGRIRIRFYIPVLLRLVPASTKTR